jgi:site-specific recombinase XerD
LLTTCGLRRSELVSIRLDDFDEVNSVVLIRGKGNKKRKAYLKRTVKEDLLKWLDIRGVSGCRYIFCKISKSGNVIVSRGLTSQAIYYLLNSYQERLGLTPFMPHDLRRTVATVLLDSGEDLVTVRDVMGHASVNTTQRYDKRGEHNKKNAMLNSEL